MTTQKIEDDSLPEFIGRSNQECIQARLPKSKTQTDRSHLHPLYSSMITGLVQHGNKSSPKKATVANSNKVVHGEFDVPTIYVEGDKYNMDRGEDVTDLGRWSWLSFVGKDGVST